MSEHTIWFELDLECQPLKSVKEINAFLFDPPAWRSLCEPLQRHSKRLIKNCELISNFQDITLENPASFCHFDPKKPPVSRHDENILPKTLVCHDMANGYHDDSAIDGTSNFSAYTFYNWAGVDIFCYFSHHLVTIPPLGWINVAHAHGVKVIGTLITEWADGSAFWNAVLASETEMQNIASSLVTIAKTLKFEGWLLNVENKIKQPVKLLEFIKQLHKMLHDEIPDAVLIWYDSVTQDGNLNWQNKLNRSNSVFFDACDGLFTNYSWKEQDIVDTVAAAGDRCFDVFVGIDVWGRNFYGGGMFNTQEAVKLVHRHGLSLAIFAPAWTHEAMDNEENSIEVCSEGEPLSPVQRFMLRDGALWGSLWPYLNTRVPCRLPFKTGFCRGLGRKRRVYGEVLSNTPWYNLRHMQYQPNSIHGPHGFLLSTKEKIKNVSRHTIRDVRGNITFRQSLYEFNKMMYEESRMIIEKQEAQEAEELNSHDKNVRRDSLSEGHEVESKENKLRSVFRNLFRFKKPKVSFDAGAAHPENSGASSSMTLQSSGRSMVHMPVQLQLGHSNDKRLAIAVVPEEDPCLEVCFEDSFNGGSCLKVNPSDRVAEEQRTIRLFHCDFAIEDTLIVCMVTKCVAGFPSQHLKLMLLATDKAGEEHTLELVARQLQHSFAQSTPATVTFFPVPHGDAAFKDLQAYLVVNEPGFYVPTENTYGWKVFYFQLRLPSYRVWTACLRAGDLAGPLLLGYLGLCARDMKPKSIPGSSTHSMGTLTTM